MTRVGLVGGVGPEYAVDCCRRNIDGWKREDPSRAPAILIDSIDVKAVCGASRHGRPHDRLPERDRGSTVRRVRMVAAVAGAVALASVIAGCGVRQRDQSTLAPVAASPECRAVSEDPTLRTVLQSLDTLRAADARAWDTYRPGGSTYVFLLRGLEERWCGVVWNAGNVSTIALAAAPRLSTPMYGFHMAGTAVTGATVASKAAGSQWTQPAALAVQLERMGVRRAVLVPLRPEIKLPFELRPLQIFNIAVHEAVHLHVQAPAWTGEPGEYAWPSWSERQPDRADLAARCYGAAGAGVEAERRQLADAAMAALTGGGRDAVCAGVRAFAESRRTRWAGIDAAAITVTGGAPDAKPMTCRQGEAVMELTEGLADFVAWMTARDAGIVSDAQVQQRLLAQQRDVFYLTGAMELIVLRHFLGEPAFARLPRTIGASASWREGELFGAVESALKDRCGS